MMQYLIIISCIYVAFMGFAGSLFGQLFFSHFGIGATLTGIFGILAAVIALLLYFKKQESKRYGFLILICSLLSGIDVCIESWNYYSKYHVPGNDFAWEPRGPFCLALLIIAYTGLKQFRQLKTKVNIISQ